MFEIPYYEVPRDQSDPSFVASFALSEEQAAREFFREFGFVVFRDCLTQMECEASVGALFDLLGFDPAMPDSWTRWCGDGMEKYAMPTRAPVFEVPFLMNRQNPNVHGAFSILLGREDLLSNHDRSCLFRPTRQVAFSTGLRDMVTWRTTHNLHLDMNPWKYADIMNRCQQTLDALEYKPNHFIFENNQVTFRPDEVPLQGVINFVDNYDEDGGFIIVPGFRNHFDDWLAANKPAKELPEGKSYDEEDNSYRFPDRHPLQQQAVRIAMRQGSVVIWDQRTPHGSTFNDSHRFRAAQFIRMFPNEISAPRAQKRAAALRKQFRDHGFTDNMITPLGRRIFGLM